MAPPQGDQLLWWHSGELCLAEVTVLRVHATPVHRDGPGTPITIHATAVHREPETPSTIRTEEDATALLTQQLVIADIDGTEHRLNLVARQTDDGDWITGHTVVITPLPAPAVDAETAQAEQDQALQAALDDVLAEEQQRAAELRVILDDTATARGWSQQQLVADFTAWSPTPYGAASFVVLGDYLEYLQTTPNRPPAS